MSSEFQSTAAPAGRRVHIVAVGGVMMSAIARLLTQQGCRVTGSDLNASEYTAALEAEGLDVMVGPHQAEHVPADTDWVAISSAVPADNPEVQEARRRGLPVLKRDAVLGAVVNARRGLAVAGTHGKTTTSGLAAVLLAEAGLDPTFLVGSVVRNYGTNGRVGSGDWVVVEADEYDRAFLSLAPEIAIVTNLEFDHPDIYADWADLVATFEQFVGQVRSSGQVLLCADCPAAAALGTRARAAVATYGFAPAADWHVANWQPDERGGAELTLRTPDGQRLAVKSGLSGRHNAQNVAAAVAAAVAAGVPAEQAAALVGAFAGTSRRFEELANAGGVRVIDDYAHHPTEVRATVAAARRLPGRLRVVFEPHQYARTRALQAEYAGAFDEADETLICDIHAARETDFSGVSGESLAATAGGASHNVHYVGTHQAARSRLLAGVGEPQTWLLMGAGNVTNLAHELATWVRERHP